jgi:hypothetical protein
VIVEVGGQMVHGTSENSLEYASPLADRSESSGIMLVLLTWFGPVVFVLSYIVAFLIAAG